MRKHSHFRRAVVVLLAGCACALAQAQYSDNVVRIGFITDLSGLYVDPDGTAGAEMIRQAIADAGGEVNGRKVELLVADHQNKADIAASKAREWLDVRGVDVLIGGVNSATSLAMAGIAAERHKPFFAVGSASAALTNEQCTPYTLHWAYDTVALAKGQGTAIVKAGGKTWFFVTADYAFGLSMEADTSHVVQSMGGVVLGAVHHPLAASDFSSYVLQAERSKAQVLALANAGPDMVNTIKAASEFGVSKHMKMAGLLVQINDVHALGLQAAQGMYVTESWYWARDDKARAFSRRFFERFKRMPSQTQAADYSAATQYLRAVKATGTDDGERVMAHLRKATFNDVYMTGGYLRADGRVIHDMYLMQVKTPDESASPWDYYKILETFKGESTWRAKGESRCSLWK